MWHRALLLTFACTRGGLGSSSHGEAKPLIGSLRAQPVMVQSHTYPQGSAPSSPGPPCPMCPSVNSILPPGTHHHFHHWAHRVFPAFWADNCRLRSMCCLGLSLSTESFYLFKCCVLMPSPLFPPQPLQGKEMLSIHSILWENNTWWERHYE